MVSVLHKELECIEEKLELEVMRPRIKDKFVLSGELTILDQSKWSFIVMID